MTKRLTTRGLATAEAIRDRVEFTTSGNMRGENRDPGNSHYIYAGYLRGLDAEALRRDTMDPDTSIDYVVWSYSTPIAWHRTHSDGTDSWHIVAQTFSITTSKHQGNLYLVGTRGEWPIREWQGMKGGVNQGYTLLDSNRRTLAHADTRKQADYLARFIMLNGTDAFGVRA